MADSTPKSYSTDPTLYLYTSLTAGSSHIITATSRLETILKANKIPFRALDVATDEKARMLWGRRSKGRKIPGLVKYGNIIGDLEEIEEWNEYGELKQQLLGAGADAGTTSTPTPIETPSKAPAPPEPTPKPPLEPPSDSEHIQIQEPAEGLRKPHAGGTKGEDTPLAMAMRQAGAEAAAKASMKKKIAKSGPVVSDSPTPDVAPVGVEPKLNKASEDPNTPAETIAAKMAEQLATERAKRTSVDEIPHSENAPEASTGDSLSKDSLLQADQKSSLPKEPTPLANETAPESTPSLSQQQLEPQARQSRGSSVSNESKEEIERAEKASAIPQVYEEGKEAKEGESKEVTKPDKAGTEDTEPGAGRVDAVDVAASDKNESPVDDEPKPESQDAKESEAAAESTED